MKLIAKKGASVSADALEASQLADSGQPAVSTGRSEQQPGATTQHSDRYYLPVLNFNHQNEWPSKPLSERAPFTDKTAYDTCLGNCCGVKGVKGACCQMDPYDLEHVLGPIDKTGKERWVEKTVAWFRSKGLEYSRSDLVIDYEEGKIIGDNLFAQSNNSNVFQQESAYPIMRFQVLGPRYACKFMNPKTYKCTIYEMRPDMCRTYYCQYILTNFLVKTKAHPNSFRKLR